MSEPKFFCICEDNCKYETMTKEQILTAIAQAIAEGKVSNADAGFITKVKETNGGSYVTFWVGTQAEYNALPSIKNNCLYIISDETSKADIDKRLGEMLPKAGGVMEGAIHTSGIVLKYGEDYGYSLPDNAEEGKLFILLDE